MTPEQRIDKLDERVTKIEDDVWGKLDAIDVKLTALTVSFAQKPNCPAPGTCLLLQERITRLEHTHDNMAKTVADLIRWRAWLTGINLVISTLSLAILGSIANYIIKQL
jgi:hypothetical protein